MRAALRQAVQDDHAPEEGIYHNLLSEAERALVDEALRMTGQNQVAASQLLGVNRTTLRNKMTRD